MDINNLIKEFTEFLEISDKLSREHWKLEQKTEKILHKAEEYGGDIENFEYDRGKYFDWFRKEFKGYWNHNDDASWRPGVAHPYYSINTHGTDAQQDKLWKKREEIIDNLCGKERKRMEEIDKKLWEMKEDLCKKYPFLPISDGGYDDIFSTENFVECLIEFCEVLKNEDKRLGKKYNV